MRRSYISLTVSGILSLMARISFDKQNLPPLGLISEGGQRVTAYMSSC